jgi:UDP-glucose 4-epimerase
VTVLITGGAGYVGSQTAYTLLDRGEQVVVLDNLSTGSLLLVSPNAHFVRGDVGDRDLVEQVVKEYAVDAVVHCAAATLVAESKLKPALYYEINTTKSLALFASVIKAGIRSIVLSSTAAVYGQPGVAAADESVPLRPISPYGTSKMMAEMILRDLAAVSDVRIAILRYFNVAGADPAARTGELSTPAPHLVKAACEVALGYRPELHIFGSDYATPDGTCIRDYIHVADIADAHVRSLDYLRAGGESIVANCGYGVGYSVMEVVQAVKRVSGNDFPVVVGDRRPGDPDRIVAHAEKIRDALAWKPVWDNLDDIVRHALAWEGVLRLRQNRQDQA